MFQEAKLQEDRAFCLLCTTLQPSGTCQVLYGYLWNGRTSQTGVSLGKTFPLPYSHLYLFIYVCTGASLMAQLVKNSSAMEETWVWSLGWEDSPGGGHGNPLQYSCLENSPGWRSLAGYSPWGHKESDVTEHSTAHVCSGSSLLCGLSLVVAAEAALCRGAQTSYCGGFSCCGSRALGRRLQWLQLMGLAAPQSVGSS